MTYRSTKVQYLDESSSDDCDDDNATSTSRFDALEGDEPCRDNCGKVAGSSDDIAAATGAMRLDEQYKHQHTPWEQTPRGPESGLAELLRDKSVIEERLAHVLRDIAELDESTYQVLASSAADIASAISAASATNGIVVLQNLKDRGKQLDCRNQDGRTPIMEAALWGRLANVLYLINQDVDYLGRDVNGMRACDLAEDAKCNRDERAKRRGNMFKEDPVEATSRKEIRVLFNQLQSPAREIIHQSSASELVSFFDKRPDGRLAYYQPLCLLTPPPNSFGGRDKAFGMLDRGPTYPAVFAMSGYSHSDLPDILDNKATTLKAEKLRSVLGLPPDKEAASHVEAQLLGYLIHTHWPYMLDDRDDLQVQADTIPSYDIHPLITDMFSSMDIVFHCVGDSFGATKKVQKSKFSCEALKGRRS